jgi:transcriptional regulator with XRE-family HTH domain
MKTKNNNGLKEFNFEKFRSKVKSLREERKMTLAEMGKVLGTTTQNYSNLEKGNNRTRPTVPQLYYIMQHFNVPFGALGGDAISESISSGSEIEKYKKEIEHLKEKNQLLSNSLADCKDMVSILKTKRA